ncbi:17148_t:CDS:1 [Entrophospora sp. SA101]|nr:9498_t:CDS:1 [Entrophospora sp. SA101]CAJ0650843.1 13765_t:CDS:1 [Entrophospora sp. SA101]CAJ0749437.1 921_t:CDS:1 [Entrophospora sp. SA101]CAJ0762018.1 17148_t:CDS:1 [Entrophospora sp. SA101]CAJ0833399.1 14299_t:CDS:1 [Entrophospora sp. SA101]
MNAPFLKSYYRRKSTYLTSEQIEIIRSLKDKVPKYRIMRDFHINEHRVDDIWEDRERQQQIIQSTISTEILPISIAEQCLKEPTLVTSTPSENFNRIGRETLYPESTPLNTEIKKKSSKSRSKSVLCNNELRSRMSDAIPTNNSNETEKISSEDLDALYERESKRDEKNKTNMTRLLAT